MAPHPLDPLSADEITLTSDVCKQHFKALHPGADVGAVIFNAVSLEEPPKAALLAGAPPRKGFALMQPPASIYSENEAYAIIEAVVDLETKAVDSWKLVRACARD
jgi:Cu2+-containing amine oxidase